jgi:predicted phosphoribosyltransferase
MFQNRIDAGRRLVSRLDQYKGQRDVIVLALPRGGVVIGYEIARSLNVPLDVLIVRKLGFPGHSELALGAVGETGTVVLNEDIVAAGRVSEDFLNREIALQKDEIARRVSIYRAGNKLPNLNGMRVILVDDGVATGATIKAAISSIKEERAAKLVVALPVGPQEAIRVLRHMVDDVICLETPPGFMAVGQYYLDFNQVSDDEVVNLLRKSAVKAA